MDADMQRGVGAHGMADDMGLVDLERVQQRDDVVALKMSWLYCAGSVGTSEGR